MTKDHHKVTVQSGCCVEIEMIYRSGNREPLIFDLVSDEQADFENGFIGVSTPLANALIGESCGYVIPYFTPEFLAIQIISIQKSSRTPETNKYLSRKESIEETLEQIEFRDAVLFASSTGTKWGSYDADGLDFSKWKSSEGKSR